MASSCASVPPVAALRCLDWAELVDREVVRRPPLERLPRLELVLLLADDRDLDLAPELDLEPPLRG